MISKRKKIRNGLISLSIVYFFAGIIAIVVHFHLESYLVLAVAASMGLFFSYMIFRLGYDWGHNDWDDGNGNY